jgi:uncharacterized membrane protein required for colicin V production
VGPVEITFLVLLLVFALVGVVRGHARELGVTTMLLIALFVLEFFSERYQPFLNHVLGIVVDPEAVDPLQAWLYVFVLVLIAFISYQGQTLTFPGGGKKLFFDLGVGLLNGYLLAGSIWYYLHRAGWPGLPICPPYSEFYQAVVQLLPPAVFGWPYFIGLAVILLIARVWK